MMANDWVADVEFTYQSPVDDDETVTGGLKANLITVLDTQNERPELLIGGPRTGIADDDEAGWPPVPVDDGERWLAAIVFGHEFRRGGDPAPRCADSTAAANILGGNRMSIPSMMSSESLRGHENFQFSCFKVYHATALAVVRTLAVVWSIVGQGQGPPPQALGGMFFFFALGATGGVTALLTSGKPIFESPHAVTGVVGLALLTMQSLLPTLFEGNPGLRGAHGLLGSSIMTLFLFHAAFRLQLGLSF
ncbi:hypothetical protein ZWY2020_000613 [Hordeum vulgare]|nr:hypothetical protein ZWY2020_000613 [Hordeum vulgare]